MLKGSTVTRIDVYVIAAAALGAIVLAAVIVGDGIARAGDNASRFATKDQPGRWMIQQTFTDGWLMYDSAEGRICVVPNAQNPDQTTRCTKSPDRPY